MTSMRVALTCRYICARRVQQAQAQAIAEQRERDAARQRRLEEELLVPSPAVKVHSFYDARGRNAAGGAVAEHEEKEEERSRQGPAWVGVGLTEHGQADEPPADDWLASLRTDSAGVGAAPAPAKARPGRRHQAPVGASRARAVSTRAPRDADVDEQGRLGPGPAAGSAQSDGTWSPPPSPPRRRQRASAKPQSGSNKPAPDPARSVCEPQGSREQAAAKPLGAPPAGDGGLHPSGWSADTQMRAGRADMPLTMPRGKGLSDEVVVMLEEDAAAFSEVINGRLLRTALSDWRDQADLAAMSYR